MLIIRLNVPGLTDNVFQIFLWIMNCRCPQKRGTYQCVTAYLCICACWDGSCKPIHLIASLLQQLSSGDATGGWNIIVVAVWKRLYNSVGNYFCTVDTLYSWWRVPLGVLKAALFLFISTHKEPIVSTITINEMLQSLVVRFWFINANVCIPLFLFFVRFSPNGESDLTVIFQYLLPAKFPFRWKFRLP